MKKIISVFLTVVMIVSIITVNTNIAFAVETNLLKGATVTVSSEIANNTQWARSNAVDGSLTKGWSSDNFHNSPNSNVWIQVEVANAISVNRVVLVPRYDTDKMSGSKMCLGFPSDFTVQVSADGSQWKTVVSETGYVATKSDGEEFKFDTQSGVKFIKVDATKLSHEGDSIHQNYRFQLMEMMAMYEEPITETESSSGIKVTASSYISGNSTWAPKNAVDGSTTKGWASNDYTSAPNRNVWIQFEYPTAIDVDNVVLVPRYGTDKKTGTDMCLGFPEDFTIQVSSDGTEWKTVISETGYTATKSEGETFSFPMQNGVKFIKIDATKLSHEGDTTNVNYRFQLMEFTASSTGYSETDDSGNKVTVSSYISGNSTWAPKNLIDGSTSKGYSSDTFTSAPDSTVSVVVEYANAEDTNRIVLVGRYDTDRKTNTKMFLGFPKDFTIEVASDKMDWKTVVSEIDYTPSNQTGEEFTFETINDVKYIKLTATELTHDGGTLNQDFRVQIMELMKYNDVVKTPLQIVADEVNLIPCPAPADTKINLPKVPEGYSISIVDSDNRDVVDLNGNIARSETTTYGVNLTLRITENSTGNYVDTKPLLVPVYKKFVAPTMTQEEIDKAHSDYQNKKYGLFVHYISEFEGKGSVYVDGTMVQTVDELTAAFDAEQFAKDMNDFGVEYVLFTAWHGDARPLFPSMTSKRWRDDRRTDSSIKKTYSDIDLIDELLDALEPYGIELHLYTHPSDGMDFAVEDQVLTGWNDETDNYATWNQYINELYYELCERYGTRIKGIWFDGMYNHIAKGDVQNRLRATCLTFNPGMILTMNTGFNEGNLNPGVGHTCPDYKCWEINRLADFDDDTKFSRYQSAVVLGLGNWWTSASQNTSYKLQSAESLFRYLVAMASISTHGGFVPSTGFYPVRDGEDLNGDYWSKGFRTELAKVNEYIEPVKESIKNTTIGKIYPTEENIFVSELDWGVSTESLDGETVYLHILNAPNGTTLTIPKPDDGTTFGKNAKILNFDGTQTDILFVESNSGYTITLPEGVSWSDIDTIVKITKGSQRDWSVEGDFDNNKADVFTFPYTGKVVVNGQVEKGDFSALAENQATYVLYANDGNVPSQKNILQIGQTEISAEGKYTFDFAFDGFRYTSDKITEYKVLVNINGLPANKTINTIKGYADWLSFHHDLTISDGKVNLASTFNNLTERAGLDYNLYIAFYSADDKLVGLIKNDMTSDGSKAESIKISDIVCPEDAVSAKVLVWINEEIPIYKAYEKNLYE